VNIIIPEDENGDVEHGDVLKLRIEKMGMENQCKLP